MTLGISLVSLFDHSHPLVWYKILPSSVLMVADTIGLLTEVSETHMVHLPNKPRPTLTRHIILRDLKYVQSILCSFLRLLLSDRL